MNENVVGLHSVLLVRLNVKILGLVLSFDSEGLS